MTIVNERLTSNESSSDALGEVTHFESQQLVDDKGRLYTREDIWMRDESDANSDLKEFYHHHGDEFERLLRSNPDWPATEVVDGRVIVSDKNPAARWLYYGANGQPTQMLEWASRFPTAIALEPLQLLGEGGAWLQAGKLDPATLEKFTYMPDGEGLRSRARIYAHKLEEYAKQRGSSELTVVSLGCGAAVPNIQATRALEAENIGVHWRFYDWDATALQFAQHKIEENNFQFATFDYGPTRINTETGREEPAGQNYLRAFALEDESVDVIDALGLWEYLKPEDARRFAEKLYTKLKPGGRMVVSNMLPSRPQREFNQRAVGWPGLYLRSDQDLLDIFQAAGIDSRQVTMAHAKDGVYVVVEVKKEL